MGSFDQYPPQIRAILEKVADAGYREILLDDDAGNRFIVNSMANSTDPTIREIGEQLRDGTLDMSQLARSDVYREALDGGLANLSRLDTDQMAADLDTALATSRDEKQESTQRSQPDDGSSTGSAEQEKQR